MAIFITADVVSFLLLDCITEYCNYSPFSPVPLQMKSLS